MQLIDYLDKRAESVSLIENVTKAKILWDKDIQGWFMSLDGVGYGLTSPALDSMLNQLKIPIKFIHRMEESSDGCKLVASVTNYWLELGGTFSFLVEKRDDDHWITQAYTNGLYIPSVKVNDYIIDLFNGKVGIESFYILDDMYGAHYIINDSSRVHKIGEQEWQEGVAILYSDCFSITPRFDGVLRNTATGATIAWPTTGRKFRVASNTLPQILDQIGEFVSISMSGIQENVLPKLDYLITEQHTLVPLENLSARMCSDLRLSRKILAQIDELFYPMINIMPDEFVLTVGELVSNYDSGFDPAVSRAIQIALSRYVVNGNFK